MFKLAVPVMPAAVVPATAAAAVVRSLDVVVRWHLLVVVPLRVMVPLDVVRSLDVVRVV